LEMTAPFLALAFLRPTGSRLARPRSDLSNDPAFAEASSMKFAQLRIHIIHQRLEVQLSWDRMNVMAEFRKKITSCALSRSSEALPARAYSQLAQRRLGLTSMRSPTKPWLENSACPVLCRCGPISSPADAAYVFERHPSINGFYEATSMERLPMETATTDQMTEFSKLTLHMQKAQVFL
jgi:hypothetical protein